MKYIAALLLVMPLSAYAGCLATPSTDKNVMCISGKPATTYTNGKPLPDTDQRYPVSVDGKWIVTISPKQLRDGYSYRLKCYREGRVVSLYTFSKVQAAPNDKSTVQSAKLPAKPGAVCL